MSIQCGEIPETKRAAHAAKLFGARFIYIESFVFDTASTLSPDYDGGLWSFHGLCNGGFYMVPTEQKTFRVQCANGFEGVLSAEAFGIACCLYAYSLLSFSPDEEFAGLCGEQFHELREYMVEHKEAASILAATD